MTNLPVPAYSAGNQLYKYNLVSRLGQGQFGQVWLANDLTLQRQYAIKILNAGVPVDQRLREAQIGHRLQHNNLVHVYQADVVPQGTEHVVILAMEYLPNGSVVKRVNPGNFLPLPEVLRVAKDVLQGLDYLHANSFYHNDIKPENIMLGGVGQAMLTDYGIMGVSANGQPTAAPNAYRLHMAPEVLATRQISARTDIFQTGLTLYRLATGISTLRMKQAALGWNDYYAALNAGTLLTNNDFPAYIPAAFRRVLLKAVDPNPSTRFQTALEMRRAIEKLSYPGYWSVRPAGDLFGVNGKYEYRFERATSATRASMAGFKKNMSSGIETRISDFCARDLTAKQADALCDKFFKHVVTG
ncbi:MAG: serine/threonine protein kinase [Hyphomicrobium sp.]|uniref:serine/threonine-protein kinase n=1 Tax=Hyphomicrobium sp. TaxID=82 RepID=UPI0025C610C8|nr:serine/threonine-protein kinase [Hyphomicrobium sp.]MBX9864807.1 serine/threonine protein kinase [Hyphomicrobium sp.]